MVMRLFSFKSWVGIFVLYATHLRPECHTHMTKRAYDAIVESGIPANDESAQEMVNGLLPMEEVLEAYRSHLRCASCANRRRIFSIVSQLNAKCIVYEGGFDESEDFKLVHANVLADCERIVAALRSRGVYSDDLPENDVFAEVILNAHRCLGMYLTPSTVPELFSVMHASLLRCVSDALRAQVPEIVDCIASYIDLRACAISKELLRFFVSRIQLFLAVHLDLLQRQRRSFLRLTEDETDRRRYQMVRSVVALTQQHFHSLPDLQKKCGMEATYIQLRMLLKQYSPSNSRCGHTAYQAEVLRDLVFEQTQRAKEEAARLQSLGFNVCDKLPLSN
jgi:hypothetical protein